MRGGGGLPRWGCNLILMTRRIPVLWILGGENMGSRKLVFSFEYEKSRGLDGRKGRARATTYGHTTLRETKAS